MGFAAKNLDLAFEVIFQVVAEPEIAGEVEALAGGKTLIFYDPQDAELSAANDQLAGLLEQRGEDFVKAELQRRTPLALR